MTKINKIGELLHTPELRIRNKYLSQYNFNKGDNIKVTYETNKLTIEKITESTIYKTNITQ